jgi:hypothetical protein
MTKVEELRDKIYTKAAGNISALQCECSPSEDRMYAREERELATDLYALIAASHAEGVEEERERIRGAAFGVFDDVGTAFLEGIRVIYIGKPIPIVEKGAAFVPASVLAPKEQP